MELRPHQKEAVEETIACIELGEENVTIEAPTSFGKSIVIAELAKRLPGISGILVNISLLIDQIGHTLHAIGEPYSVLKAGRDESFNPKTPIQIIMSQTFYARKDKLSTFAIDYIIQDERHKEYMTDRTIAIQEHCKPKGIIGLTATPYDQSGFALPNTHIIRTISVRELEDAGWLCPIRYFVPKWAQKVDYSQVKKSGVDYSTSQLEEITNKKNHLNKILDSMDELDGKNKKGIVFCSSIEQSDIFANMMRARGYFAESYHSETENSDEKMEAYKTNTNRKIANKMADKESLFNKEAKEFEGDPVTWLVAVDKVSIGFSVEDITMMVSMRPTKVLSLYRQMVGRGVRIHPSKKDCIYLDCAQNISTHGFHYDDYIPPERGLDQDENREKLRLAKEPLMMEDLYVTLGDELEEINRKDYDKKLIEIKKKLIKEPSEMTIQELGTAYELTKDAFTIIAIGSEIMTRKFGKPISRAGNRYDYDPSWIASDYNEKFEKYPEMKAKWTRSLKTRCRNIIKEGKNFNALKFFLDFLEEKHIENSHSFVRESIEEKKRLQEEDAKKYGIPDFDDISDDDIPFSFSIAIPITSILSALEWYNLII